MGCILCNSDGTFRHELSKRGYHIQTCNQCGLAQLHPLPPKAVLDSLYDDSYFSHGEDSVGYGNYGDQEKDYLVTFADDVERILPHVPEGKILDVGCGFGYFVRMALDAGYDAYGVDIAEKAIETAQRQLPGRVFLGTVESVKEFDGCSFDVIFVSHLIEHITNPVAFVSNLCQYLSDEGIVVFVTPNIGSLLAKVSRSRWVSFKVPEHVAYYSPKTIRELFRRSGLETVTIENAYQSYRLPFVVEKVRSLIRPIDRLIPRVEDAPLFREKIVRVPSGSLRAIARKLTL